MTKQELEGWRLDQKTAAYKDYIEDNISKDEYAYRLRLIDMIQ